MIEWLWHLQEFGSQSVLSFLAAAALWLLVLIVVLNVMRFGVFFTVNMVRATFLCVVRVVCVVLPERHVARLKEALSHSTWFWRCERCRVLDELPRDTIDDLMTKLTKVRELRDWLGADLRGMSLEKPEDASDVAKAVAAKENGHV